MGAPHNIMRAIYFLDSERLRKLENLLQGTCDCTQHL